MSIDLGLMWFYLPVYCTIQGIICPRTHDIYCSEPQARSIFMCPRTNKPLYCTVDWEIKLLSHINPALLLVQSLTCDVILFRVWITRQIPRYPPVRSAYRYIGSRSRGDTGIYLGALDQQKSRISVRWVIMIYISSLGKLTYTTFLHKA